MAGSPEFVEFSGQKTARLPEKSSFSLKCSLLSQYLKVRGSFGDLRLGMICSSNNDNNSGADDESRTTGNGNGSSDMFKQTPPPPTTMNLFPMSERHDDVNTPSAGLRSMDLFPQQSEDLHKKVVDSCVNKPVNPETQNPQLTIFYGGQVIVFNDFPADKAKEVMLLASQGNSFNGFSSIPVKSRPVFSPDVAKPAVESSPSISVGSVPNFGNNLIQERMQDPPRTAGNDLPIARKASLHRFLEKRKDRIISRSPYQTSGLPTIPSKPAAEIKSWLGLAAQ